MTLPNPFKVEGNIGRYPKKSEFYRYLLNNSSPKIVCETGFNAGHSADLILKTISPSSILYSFDIFEHDYVTKCAEIITQKYDNIRVINGDSKATLPQKLKEIGKIDFAIIDGGHDTETVFSDIKHFAESINSKGILIIDDLHMPTVVKALFQHGIDGFEPIKYPKDLDGSPMLILRKT